LPTSDAHRLKANQQVHFGVQRELEKVHKLLYSEEENMEDNPRNIYHLHTSNLTSQELYANQLRQDQEREDRELAERLQNSL
jgi:hypothetical protein